MTLLLPILLLMALAACSRSGRITMPTLVIGANHDTMDPARMEWMAKQIPHARFLLCPDGSHLAMYDDQQVYMAGLIGFLKDIDGGRF